jgi:hypothetical protein
MALKEKNQPSIAPGPPGLSERLALALTDEAVRRPFIVKMKVGGGLRSQAYSFDFTATGDGRAECRFECRLSGRSGESRKSTFGEKDFLTLLRKVLSAVRLPQHQPRFLPDTLVGIIEVSDGHEVYRIYFAADPDQAETQGLTPRPELVAAINAIYSAGAKLTGQRSIKP